MRNEFTLGLLAILSEAITPEFYATYKTELDKLAHTIEVEGKDAHYAQHPEDKQTLYEQERNAYRTTNQVKDITK